MMKRQAIISFLVILSLAILVIFSSGANASINPNSIPYDQRHNYASLANKRFNELKKDKSQLEQKPATTTSRPSILSDYVRRQSDEKESPYAAVTLKNPTPRQTYLKQYFKLPASTQQALAPKRDDLVKAYMASHESYITLSTADFKHLAMQGHRPYWLWITFTSLSDASPCIPCQTFHTFFSQVAPIIQDNTSISLNNDNDPLPLIVAVLTPSSAPEVWQALGLRRAPVSTLLPPEFNPQTFIQVNKVVDAGIFRQNMLMNPSVEDITSPLQLNGFNIIPQNTTQTPFLVLTILFTIMALLTAFVWYFRGLLLTIRQLRVPFMFAAVGFFLYCAVGAQFNSLQRVYNVGRRDGEVIFFNTSFQDQYAIESLFLGIAYLFTIIGFLLSVAAITPFGLHAASIGVKQDKEDQNNKTSSSTTDQRPAQARCMSILMKFVSPEVIFTIGIISSIVSFWLIVKAFSFKLPGYPYSL